MICSCGKGPNMTDASDFLTLTLEERYTSTPESRQFER